MSSDASDHLLLETPVLVMATGGRKSFRTYKNTSDVWIFYSKISNGGVCKICSKEVRGGGGTSNLRNHIKRKHNKIWTAHLQNRLDNGTLTILDEPVENGAITVTHVEAAVNYSSGDNVATSSMDEEAVHSLQAYTSEDGGTVIFLQPASKMDTTEQNGDFQQNVVLMEQTESNVNEQETILPSGDIIQNPTASNETTNSPSTDSRIESVDPTVPIVKMVTGSGRNIQTFSSCPSAKMASNYVLKKLTNNSSAPVTKSLKRCPKPRDALEDEDSFDHFGRYLASLLRNLPSRKNAYKLQKEIICWVLQEQVRLDS